MYAAGLSNNTRLGKGYGGRKGMGVLKLVRRLWTGDTNAKKN